jgi:hypothetical protein
MHADEPLKGTIAYHPYLALIATFDHAAYVQLDDAGAAGTDDTPKGRMGAIAKEFKRHCKTLRKELSDEAKRFPNDIYRSPKFDPYLYRSHCMASLGYADDVGFVLIDSFVAATRLTAVLDGIESSDLAFCPKIESILLENECPRVAEILPKDERKKPRWPFIEPHEAFRESDSRPPLCVITHLKTNLLASSPHGLKLQECVYTTLLKTIRRALAGMLAADDTEHQGVYEKDSVRSLQCLLLETQGAEDVSLIFFCNNYSIASTLVAVVRSLQLSDMKECTGVRFEQCLDRSKLHAKIARHAQGSIEKEDPLSITELMQVIGGNHVFMTSYSTLCFDQQLLEESERPRVSGRCEAQVYFDINPGHEHAIANSFDAAILKTFPPEPVKPPETDSTDQTQKQQPDKSAQSDAETFGILPGLHDISAGVFPGSTMHSSTDDPAALKVQVKPRQIETGDFFAFLGHFLRNARETKTSQANGGSATFTAVQTRTGSATRETGFLGITSALTLRIPKANKTSSPTLRAHLSDDLPRPVNWPSHQFGCDFFVDIRRTVATELKLNNLLDVRDSLREIGCPPALQYVIIYMCQEFL